jgi:Holliday junction resolvase RusA-like endonuclease
MSVMPEMTIGPIISIRIPLDPPAALFPNARNRRGGFHPGISAAADFHSVATFAMREHAPDTPITGPVSLGIYAAYGHGRRIPDLDATVSACKKALDALMTAGIILDDRQITSITVGHEKLRPTKDDPRPAGWTELRIVEMEEPA